MGEVPRVDEETKEVIRKMIAESRPQVSYRSDTPRFRVILEVLIATAVCALAARAYQEGVFQANVMTVLKSIRTEVNAIQSKVQAPYPSDPPPSDANGAPPTTRQNA